MRCPHCDRVLRIPRAAVAPPPAPPRPPLPPPADEAISESELPVVVPLPSPGPLLRRRPFHQRRRQLLALALALLACFSALPVVLVLAEPARDVTRELVNAPTLDTWALLVVLAFLLQLVYVLYLLQIPDWSAAWVVSLFLLSISTAYATLLGIRLLASGGNAIVAWLQLERNPFSRGQEVLWCLLMTLLTGMLTYVTGRFAQRWREAGKAVAGNNLDFDYPHAR
jgi:hypothetical protein